MSDTVLATDSAVHHAHEAYLTSINSNDVARFLTTVTDDITTIRTRRSGGIRIKIRIGRSAVRRSLRSTRSERGSGS